MEPLVVIRAAGRCYVIAKDAGEQYQIETPGGFAYGITARDTARVALRHGCERYTSRRAAFDEAENHSDRISYVDARDGDHGPAPLDFERVRRIAAAERLDIRRGGHAGLGYRDCDGVWSDFQMLVSYRYIACDCGYAYRGFRTLGQVLEWIDDQAARREMAEAA